jgi:hypothetical protein
MEGALMSFKSVAAVVAVGAAFLAWLTGPDRRVQPVQTVVAATTLGAPLVDEDVAESATSTSARVPAPVTSLASPTDVAQLRPGVAARAATLLVRLTGVAPQHLSEFTVRAQLGGEAVSDRFDSAGTARLDVGPLLAALSGSTREPLSVTAQHPLYLDEHTLVHWPSAEVTTHPCALTPRAASALSGRVRVPPGCDVTAVCVRLSDERGQVVSAPEFWPAHGSCDAEGRFELKLAVVGLHRLTATSPDTLPCEVWCMLEAYECLELPDIELDAGGVEIIGSVLLPGGTKAPPSGEITVRAHWRGAPVEPHPRTVIDRGNARSYAVLRGGPRPMSQLAVVSDDRSFALRGLDEGPWQLEVHGFVDSTLLAPSETRIVAAPATGVVLWDDRCLLTVQVVDADGRPIDGVDVRWSVARNTGTVNYSTEHTFTDAEGRVSVVGAIAHDYLLTVRRTGGEPVQVEWPALGRGVTETQLIELPASTTSTLVLRLEAGSVELATANLRLRSVPGNDVRHDLRATLTDGAYRFEQLEPGAYRAFLGPSDDRGPVAFYGELVQTTELDVELPPGGTSEVAVTLSWGGRVRVEVEAVPALDTWLQLELHGPDGAERPFVGVAHLMAGAGFGPFPRMIRALHLSGSNAIQDALPPGRYVLRCSLEGWQVEAPTIDVRAGEVTTITLVARKR